MAFFTVPSEVGTDRATVRVYALNEGDVPNRQLRLTLGGSSSPPYEASPGPWREWRTFDRKDPGGYARVDRAIQELVGETNPIETILYHRRVEFDGLAPATDYTTELVVDGNAPNQEPLKTCAFRTLPEELPAAGDGGTFNMLLGSCFYRPRDRQGMVGKTFALLPPDYKPHVKALCGDQVYVDNPWHETSIRWWGSYGRPGYFREMLLDKYYKTWTQCSQAPPHDHGFNLLLSGGANYFCSDDHEFWNNAPNFGVVGFANTLTPGQRSWWFEEGRKLFRAFQSPSSVQGFEIGSGPQSVSVRVVDTRIDRYPSRVRFMLQENLQELRDWMAALEGPGVLVLGQPILGSDAPRTLVGRATSIFDKDLPYYGQYAELLQGIEECDHSIVVLTGDVHFGRVAASPPEADGTTRFLEVISSPMCHVTGAKKSGYKPARTPQGWPPLCSTNPFAGPDHTNHFATVRFSKNAQRQTVDLTVDYWPILEPGRIPTAQPMQPAATFEFELR